MRAKFQCGVWVCMHKGREVVIGEMPASIK